MPKSSKKLNVAIIGAGNIGTKRIQAILELGQDKVVGVYDINKKKAKELALISKSTVYLSAKKLLEEKFIDSIIISTTTNVSVNLTSDALKAKKNVLVEKPLGANASEARALAKLARKFRRILKVGFNHRHHPAVNKAHELVEKGILGEVFYIKAVYGHGARPGYDSDWRMKKQYSIGGELLDQGVHIVDLVNWFVGNFISAFANTKNYFWRKSELEDNAFCQLVSKNNQIVEFHVSLTQWKNKFLFEIFGSKGYIVIQGLGRSYGVEALTLGTGVGRGKVPKEKTWKFAGEDISWKNEWKEFRQAVLESRQPLANGNTNIETMKILDALYRSSKKGKIIKI